MASSEDRQRARGDRARDSRSRRILRRPRSRSSRCRQRARPCFWPPSPAALAGPVPDAEWPASWPGPCGRMIPAIAAILCMLALGFVTKYSGMDAVLGPGVHPDRTGPLPHLRHAARLAGRGPDRLGHIEQCPLRQPAEDHRDEIRARSHPHGLGQFDRRSDGQDDRRSIDRRRRRGHGGGGARRGAAPRRLLAQHCCWRYWSVRSCGSTPTSFLEPWSRPCRPGNKPGVTKMEGETAAGAGWDRLSPSWPSSEIFKQSGRQSGAVGPPGRGRAPGPTAQPLLRPCLRSRSSG